MYVVIQTDDATKQAITSTFASIDELNKWTQSQLPTSHEKDIHAILESILKPEIFKSILVHVENNAPVNSIHIDKPDPGYREEKPSEDTPKDKGFQQVCLDQPSHDLNHTLFKMPMHDWVADTSTLKMEQVNFSVEKEKAALQNIQTRFFELYCKEEGVLNVLDGGLFEFQNIHKFVWVLALNFPSIFFKDHVIGDIEFLKTCKTTNKAENLLRYYSEWEHVSRESISRFERFIVLDKSKCNYIVWLLQRTKLIHSISLTNEAFVFKTLFYYYDAKKTISDELVSLWTGLFLDEQITKTAEGSIQSSELLGMFRVFLSNILKKDDMPSEIYELYTKFEEYMNPKTFARALKSHNITDTTRKSAGIFYTGIARRYVGTKQGLKDKEVEINGFNTFQTNYEGLKDDSDVSFQYAKWEK